MFSLPQRSDLTTRHTFSFHFQNCPSAISKLPIVFQNCPSVKNRKLLIKFPILPPKNSCAFGARTLIMRLYTFLCSVFGASGAQNPMGNFPHDGQFYFQNCPFRHDFKNAQMANFLAKKKGMHRSCRVERAPPSRERASAA